MLSETVAAVDARIGELIERANRNQHRRRLARAGWRRAFAMNEAVWARGVPPPRERNDLRVLIDGGAAIPEIAAAIRAARHSVHIAGWAISPDFAMERGRAATTLRELLAEAAEHVTVRVLTWSGAPIPVIHPTRAESRRALDQLIRGTRIRGALDARNRPMHCHHEKLVVVDGGTAFVGGIDLTHMGGDRYDTSPHPQRDSLGWHDAAAQLQGPAVADVAAHFAMRWEATTGEPIPVDRNVSPAGTSTVQVIRTVPEKLYAALPQGDFSILEVYLSMLHRAERFIYLENQFLWSTEVVDVLRDKLLRPPSRDFRLCIVLPRRPNNGSDDTRGQLGVLQEANREGSLLVGTIGPPPSRRTDVYVHAKIGIIDDTCLTLGSANLNEHSLFNDTEVNLLTDDAHLARDVRERLWSEHLQEDCRGRDPLSLIEERWRPLLNDPAQRAVPLRPLANVSRRSARLLGPLKGLAVDG